MLFVHGAGTPAEVAFDVPYQDYSWMEYLARAGFDVFAMDMTGYGRSTRPPAMDDPCNLSRAQQAAFVPSKIPQPCAATFTDRDDDDELRLGRHRRGRRSSARGAARGARVARRMVAGRSAHRRLRRAAPREGARLVVLAPAYGRTGARERAERLCRRCRTAR